MNKTREDKGTVDVQKEKTAETAALKTRGRFFRLDRIPER